MRAYPKNPYSTKGGEVSVELGAVIVSPLH